jgi:hypothetical protein
MSTSGGIFSLIIHSRRVNAPHREIGRQVGDQENRKQTDEQSALHDVLSRGCRMLQIDTAVGKIRRSEENGLYCDSTIGVAQGKVCLAFKRPAYRQYTA